MPNNLSDRISNISVDLLNDVTPKLNQASELAHSIMEKSEAGGDIAEMLTLTARLTIVNAQVNQIVTQNVGAVLGALAADSTAGHERLSPEVRNVEGE